MVASCAAMWLLLAAPWLVPRHEPLHARRFLWAALVLPSPLLVYGGTAWSEPTAAALLVAVVVTVLRRSRTWVLVTVAALAGLSRDVAPLIVLALGLASVLAGVEPRDRRRVLTAIGAGAATAVVLTAAWNLFRFGVPRSATYATRPFIVTEPAIVLANGLVLLLAPNGGILPSWASTAAFVPVVARGVRAATASRARRLALACLGAAMAVFLIVLACWYSPVGWNAWGPRLFLGVAPAILFAVLAVVPPLPTSTVRIVAGLAAAGALLGSPNLLVRGDNDLVDRFFDGSMGSPAVTRSLITACHDEPEICVLNTGFLLRPSLLSQATTRGLRGAGVLWLVLGEATSLAALAAWLTGRDRPASRRGLRLDAVPIDDPVARRLEAAMSAEIVVRYGGEEFEPPLPAELFVPPAGVFVVARLDGEPVGCAGIRRLDDERCELKRMYVADEARGRGVARARLARLEDEARALGYRQLWLETGTAQPEAIGLYESAGYEPIANYGAYADDPRSRCYAKRLTPAPAG
jgi:GNAT superfamily N-acetyltransferase